MNTEAKIVALPGAKAPPRKPTDEMLAKEIRAAYRKLCKSIDAGTAAGLDVRCFLDSTDTYGGGLVRGRDITITRKI